MSQRASYQKIPNLTLGQKRLINTPSKKPTSTKPVKLSSIVPVIAPKPQGRPVLHLKN